MMIFSQKIALMSSFITFIKLTTKDLSKNFITEKDNSYFKILKMSVKIFQKKYSIWKKVLQLIIQFFKFDPS